MSVKVNKPKLIPGADEKIDPPKEYAVVVYNDDYTSMDFVVRTLKKHFALAHDAATEIMMVVHEKGQAVAKVYPQRDVAETKATQVMNDARKAGHPLMVAAQPL